jgi:hypothetical protein
MPISANNKEYVDMFSNTLSFYTANAGDKQTYQCRLFETVRVEESGSVLFSYNSGTKTVYVSGINFLTEGFESGDEIQIIEYNSNGNVHNTHTTDVLLAASNFLILVTGYSWDDTKTTVIVLSNKTGQKKNGLTLEFNFVNNGGTLTPNSPIDGIKTVLTFDLTGTVFNQVVNGVQVNNKSGQYEVTASIKDKTTYPNIIRQYDLEVNFIQCGVLTESLFDLSNCIKPYFGTLWARTFGDPANNTNYIISDDSNTGWFDEAFNTGIIDAELVVGISSLNHSGVTTGQIQIDSGSPFYGFGSSYIPLDDNYFKNQPESQSNLSMTVETTTGPTPITLTSPSNPSGANYTLEFDNPVTIGTITTWDYTFTPNAQFTTFIEGRDEGDRLFYVWAKYGNVNLLLFNEQLVVPIPQGDPLTVLNHNLYDHSENITTLSITESGFSGNIEDDVAFLADFLIPNDSVITFIACYMEAFNTVTNESFVLDTVNFDFGSIPMVGGIYPVNANQTIITTLPTTSVKREAILERKASLDTLTDYCLHIHYPFFYHWEEWIAQVNANADFYPNEQTKNWFPYDTTGNWTVRTRLTANIDGLNSEFTQNVTIKDYDSDPNLTNQITLYRELTNSAVTVIVEGELHKIEGRHILTSGVWDTPTVWGMITVEPTKSSPRWICSTVVAFDNDLANPLSPLPGNIYATLTFPTPNVAKITCYFDPNKINLSNGVKFTSKIKGCHV